VAQLKEKFRVRKKQSSTQQTGSPCKLTLCRRSHPQEISQAFGMKFGKNTDASTLAIYRKTNDTHISGLVDIHLNAILSSTTTDINLQSLSIPPMQAVPPPQPCSATHNRYSVTGRCIPRSSTSIPSFTCGTHDNVEFVQTDCSWQQETSQSKTLHPEPTDMKQQKDGIPNEGTRSKLSLKTLYPKPTI